MSTSIVKTVPPSRSSDHRKTTQVNTMNTEAVQRIDSRLKEIVLTVPVVLLYEFDENTTEWERTSVEGTLFVYKRHSETSPSAFAILNKLNSSNVLQLIPSSESLEARVQSTFLLYKTEDGKIFGLCFTDEGLCKKVCQTLKCLSSSSAGLPTRTSSAPHFTSKPDSSFQIPKPSRSSPVPEETDSDPIQFSASGYSHSNHKKLASKLRSSSGRHNSEPSSPTPNNSRQRQKEYSKRAASPLSHLTTNSQNGHSLSSQLNHTPPSARGCSSALDSSNVMKKLFESPLPLRDAVPTSVKSVLFSSGASTEATPLSNGVHVPVTPIRPLSLEEVEGKITAEAFKASSSQNGRRTLLQPSVFSQSDPMLPSSATNHSNAAQVSAVPVSVQPPTPLAGPPASSFPPIPPLIHSPGMRAPPQRVADATPVAATSGVGSTSPVNPTVNHSSSCDKPVLSSSEEDTPSAECGLSKAQLQQAMLYLIQNDSDFVERLHQAYRLSVLEKCRKT